MSRASTLILLGILVIIAPFSGLPISIRNLLAIVFGACVLGIGISMRTHAVRRSAAPSSETTSSNEPPIITPQGVSPI